MGLFSKLLSIKGDSAKELEDMISSGALLVDVRSHSEFESGHVKGSINIPADEVLRHLDELHGKGPIIVFCRSGNRSEFAKRLLKEQGFKKVINGGSWQNVNQYIK